MQHISSDSVTCPSNLLEVLISLKLFQNVIETFRTKVLLLDFDEFLQMILELSLLELFEVVSAKDHVLDQLGDFLVKLDHIWLSVDEALDGLPVLEQEIVIGLLRATSETVH